MGGTARESSFATKQTCVCRKRDLRVKKKKEVLRAVIPDDGRQVADTSLQGTQPVQIACVLSLGQGSGVRMWGRGVRDLQGWAPSLGVGLGGRGKACYSPSPRRARISPRMRACVDMCKWAHVMGACMYARMHTCMHVGG